MNYELNLTTSRLRRTPPIHCVAGGELGADHLQALTSLESLRSLMLLVILQPHNGW